MASSIANGSGGRDALRFYLTKIVQFVLVLATTLLGLVAVTFLIGRVVPIDPVIAIVGDRAPAHVYERARQELGLDLPERRIGLSAHDFAQSLGAPEIVLTRAAKVAGAPTVASRFVQRLAAVADDAHWKAARARGERYLGFARALDQAPHAPMLETMLKSAN